MLVLLIVILPASLTGELSKVFESGERKFSRLLRYLFREKEPSIRNPLANWTFKSSTSLMLRVDPLS